MRNIWLIANQTWYWRKHDRGTPTGLSPKKNKMVASLVSLVKVNILIRIRKGDIHGALKRCGFPKGNSSEQGGAVLLILTCKTLVAGASWFNLKSWFGGCGSI